MSKLSEIVTGWVNYMIQPEDIKALMKERLSICDTCPSKKHLKEGHLLTVVTNDPDLHFYCSGCGCPLAAAAANPKIKCPQKKWPENKNIQSYL